MSAIIYHQYWHKTLTVNRDGDLADIGHMLA